MRHREKHPYGQTPETEGRSKGKGPRTRFRDKVARELHDSKVTGAERVRKTLKSVRRFFRLRPGRQESRREFRRWSGKLRPGTVTRTYSEAKYIEPPKEIYDLGRGSLSYGTKGNIPKSWTVGETTQVVMGKAELEARFPGLGEAPASGGTCRSEVISSVEVTCPYNPSGHIVGNHDKTYYCLAYAGCRAYQGRGRCGNKMRMAVWSYTYLGPLVAKGKGKGKPVRRQPLSAITRDDRRRLWVSKLCAHEVDFLSPDWSGEFCNRPCSSTALGWSDDLGRGYVKSRFTKVLDLPCFKVLQETGTSVFSPFTSFDSRLVEGSERTPFERIKNWCGSKPFFCPCKERRFTTITCRNCRSVFDLAGNLVRIGGCVRHEDCRGKHRAWAAQKWQWGGTPLS